MSGRPSRDDGTLLCRQRLALTSRAGERRNQTRDVVIGDRDRDVLRIRPDAVLGLEGDLERAGRGGVPVMAPVVPFRVSPAGRVPSSSETAGAG